MLVLSQLKEIKLSGIERSISLYQYQEKYSSEARDTQDLKQNITNLEKIKESSKEKKKN